MQAISVYINPRSSGNSDYWQERISKSFFRSDLIFHRPSDLEELRSMLASDIESQVDAIVSVGGDGTAHTIIQEIAGRDIGLLVIPCGTANDLAHELGTDKNIRQALLSIRNHHSKKIDLVCANGKFMATNGGFGLGGTVAQKINHLRKQYPMFKKLMHVSGKRIYSLFVAQELLATKIEQQPLRVESPEFSGEVLTTALFINNQPTLAGSFTLAPFTENNDGKFNVIILTHKSRGSLIQCVLKIVMGMYPVDDPNFITFESKQIKISSLDKKDITFFGDGEVLGSSPHWNLELAPSVLKVFGKVDEKIESGIYQYGLI